MKLSNAEHKIKKDLADRQTQPGNELWNNIQKELDQTESKSKTPYPWWKVGSVAALICLSFLAYRVFDSRPEINTAMVLNSKDSKAFNLTMKANPIDIVVAESAPVMAKIKPAQDQILNSNEVIAVETADNSSKETTYNKSLDDEVDRLLAEANSQLKLKNEDKRLVAEVNKLLDDVMSETDDVQQRSILEDMKATVLLAEVESEIELEKPPLLKFEIWDAIVTNFNQVKDRFALN